MLRRALFLLCLALFASAAPAPRAAAWRRSAAQADAAWERAAGGDTRAVAEAQRLYAAAWRESGERAHEQFYESVRVALVGCLHSALPTRDAIHAVLAAELAATAHPANGGAGFTQISQLAALALLDAADMLRVARAWARAFEPDAPAAAPPRMPPLPPTAARLRVGYMTRGFGDHPIGHQLGALLRGHNRSAFTVVCFATAASDGSALRAAARAACDEWSEWPAGAPAAALAAAIRASRLHALLALDGYDAGHRMDVLALRPAPAVLSFFGFLATTGAAYVDGIVADARALPPADEPLYAEAAVLRHPTTLFLTDYQAQHPEVTAGSPAWPAAEAAAEAAAAGNASAPAPFTFCCFSQLFKVSPALAASWERILAGAPRARLLLFDHPPVARAGLLASHPRLAAAAAAGRLLFQGRLPRGEHLLRKRAACALALDSDRYNGHSSVADMLWAGVPVLTLAHPDAAAAGKAGASIVAAAGAPAVFYSAASLAEYEERALAVAAAAARRWPAAGAEGSGGSGDDAPRAGDAELLWRPSQASPLFDRARWVREFEADVLLPFLQSRWAAQQARDEGEAAAADAGEGVHRREL